MEKTKHEIRICMGSSCFSRGNGLNVELLRRLQADGTLDVAVSEIVGSLCAGHCKDGPIVAVDGVLHTRVTPSTLQDILPVDAWTS